MQLFGCWLVVQLCTKKPLKWVQLLQYHKIHVFICKSLTFSFIAKAFISFLYFSYVCTKKWNSLPPHILQSQTLSSFRSHMKTHYFQSAYPAPKHPSQCALILFWDFGAILNHSLTSGGLPIRQSRQLPKAWHNAEPTYFSVKKISIPTALWKDWLYFHQRRSVTLIKCVKFVFPGDPSRTPLGELTTLPQTL